MKRVLAFALLAVTVVAACGGTSGGTTGGASPAASAKAAKIGLVTDVGGLNDKSFNQAANAGRLQAEKDLGVQTQVIESKKQEDYVPNLTTFAQQNYDLVIAVGLLMQHAAWKLATHLPHVKLAIIDGARANYSGDDGDITKTPHLL